MDEHKTNTNLPYLHGFSKAEQDRLRSQAEFAEYMIYQDINFSNQTCILEIGSGVGAQTEILLRRFPNIKLTCIDQSEKQIQTANEKLGQIGFASGRYEILKMDAKNMEFNSAQFDGAFICWVLEHIPDPMRVLSEVRRVLRPGSPLYVTEVMNSSFFLDPYSPHIWKYWMAYNDYQFDHSGDPFIGAKLGNLLLMQGYRDIRTNIKSWHFDNRLPGERRQAIRMWKELLLSAADLLVREKFISPEGVEKMKEEFRQVESHPNAVFYDAFVQAVATV